MKMMKKLYLCLLMLTLVGAITVTAQEKKEKTKTEKVKKEKKAKKEKAPKAPKAQSGKKSKSSGSSESQKKPKAGTVEFDANQKASIVAMDSLLRNYRQISNELTMEHIWRFSDMQCERFKNDPNFMIGIADLYMTSLGNEGFAAQRYSEIKKRYPTNMEVYMKEANLFFQFAWLEYPTYDIEFLQKAKVQIDSAKIMFPQEVEPYLRWAYWQAPYRQVRMSGYEEFTVDNELAELKKKFPNNPCYRSMARYYNYDLSKKEDKMSEENRTNYIVYAVEFYEKEDPKLMTNPDIVDYADLCNRTNDQASMEKGLQMLDYGIQQNPNYPYFYRYKLWVQTNLAGKYRRAGEKEKAQQAWKEVLEAGVNFFENFDSIGKLTADYQCMAMANYELKAYDQAISYYNKQLEIEKDTMKRLSSMFDIINCYNRQDQYDNAIKSFTEYEALKKAAGKTMEYYDYNSIISAYVYTAIDTLVDKEKRIRYFQKADTLLMLSSEASPEYITQINQRRLKQVTLPLIPLIYGDGLGNKLFAFPEVLESAQRLEAAVLSSTEMKDLEYYMLMEAYYYEMLHYWFGDNDEQAYNLSEKMLSVDMPTDFELESLTKSQKKEYNSYSEIAMKVNTMYAPKYGKKKKKK
jgi:tetratricopeptide (TPR) repeat protein